MDDSISILLLISSLIDMAEQGAPQTSKEPKRKGFRNRLKKMFGRGTVAVVTVVTGSDDDGGTDTKRNSR